MRKLAAVVLVALIVGGGALYVLVVRPLVSPVAGVPSAEAALATPDLVVLAAVNVKQVAFLERWLLGAPIVHASQPVIPPTDQRSLLDHLAAARVDPRRDIDALLYGLYPTGERGLHQALVIVGRFDAPAVEHYIARELHGTRRPAAGRSAYDVRRVNPLVCEDVTTWTVTVDPRWVLVGDPASHDAVLSRLVGGAIADDGALAWWRPLAHADVLSVGVWHPKDVERTVTGPFLRTSAHTLTVKADLATHLYVGLGARTVPPSGRLRLVVDATDGARMRQQIDEWARALRESRAQWAATAPSLGSLFDSLTVTTQGDRQAVEFVVDRTLVSNLERAANEVVGALFAGLGGRRATPPQRVPAERIDPTPPAFAPVATVAGLGPYDPAAMFAEEVDQIQGPFGVRVGAVRLPAQADAGLELVLEAFAGKVPNVIDPAGRAQLFVDSVTDAAGHELLRPEPCGRQRNTEPADFTAPGGGRLRAEKSVRLVAGADPHAAQAVTGHIELRLPTRVQTLEVAHPGPGATLTSHGATLTLTRVDGGVVGYQITGAPDRVLHISALNAAGQPLASDSAFRVDFLLGDGVAGEKRYTGRVDRVAAVFAVDEERARWPFTLTDLSMAGPRGMVARELADFRPYGLRDLRRDVPNATPLTLSFDRAQSMFKTKLDFTLSSPALPNFEHAFTVGRLQLRRIELKDGATEPATASIGLRFGTTAKAGTLTKSFYLLVDAPPTADTIKAVAGILTLQLPRTIRTVRLDDLTPGAHAEVAGLSVTVTGRGRRHVTLQAGAGGDRVLDVRFAGSDGQPLVSLSPSITESPDGAWRFDLSPQGAPARAEVVFAGDLDRKDYPFRLVLK